MKGRGVRQTTERTHKRQTENIQTEKKRDEFKTQLIYRI
jgi:hypothetical protein